MNEQEVGYFGPDSRYEGIATLETNNTNDPEITPIPGFEEALREILEKYAEAWRRLAE